MTTRILAALAFAGLLTGTAAAADLYVPTPDQAIVSASRDWTGFYIGANVGYADFDAAHYGDDSDLATLNGWQGGVQAGYNVQFDSIVLGIEADLSAAGIIEGSDTDHWNEGRRHRRPRDPARPARLRRRRSAALWHRRSRRGQSRSLR